MGSHREAGKSSWGTGSARGSKTESELLRIGGHRLKDRWETKELQMRLRQRH